MNDISPVMYDRDDVREALAFFESALLDIDHLPRGYMDAYDLEKIRRGLGDLRNILDKIENT